MHFACLGGGIGRHAGLKILFAEKASAGSIPARGTLTKPVQGILLGDLFFPQYNLSNNSKDHHCNGSYGIEP